MVTVSAPGKLLLFGEHAVVYGQPCIVTAVGERVTVSIEKTDDRGVTIDAPKVNNTRFVEEAVKQAAAAWGGSTTGLKITTDSTFSSQYGFGSSSAVTVAVLEALQLFFGKKAEKHDVFDLAYRTILAVQGVGSGFDAAAATWGGTLLYTRGGILNEPLRPPEPIPLVIGYTGTKADTPTIVREVAAKYEQFPEKMERIFKAIGTLSLEAKQKILEGDWERVGKLMDFNQEYLRDIGVSSERLEALISAAKKAGALGAKLSGAGGGDCMIALAAKEKRDALRKAIADAGGTVLEVSVHAEGVRSETTDDQKELFIVVDEKDTILGYRTRKDCHADKSLIHRSTNTVLFDKTGRVLLQKRSMTKDTSPGKWTVSATGHVNKGESWEVAARRELQEELGIGPVQLYLIDKYVFHYPSETEMESLYRGEYEGDFRINPLEVSEVRYFSKEELRQSITRKEVELTLFALDALKRIHFL